eukprot:5162741-Ditylum_brightwellii.AAC.1
MGQPNNTTRTGQDGSVVMGDASREKEKAGDMHHSIQRVCENTLANAGPSTCWMKQWGQLKSRDSLNQIQGCNF